MKKCPYCAEEIQDGAIYCRYCQHDLIEKKIISDNVKNQSQENNLYLKTISNYLHKGFWGLWIIQFILIGVIGFLGGIVQDIAKILKFEFLESIPVILLVFSFAILRIYLSFRIFQVAKKLSYSQSGAFFITLFSLVSPFYAYIIELLSLNKIKRQVDEQVYAIQPKKDYKIASIIFKLGFWMVVIICLFVIYRSVFQFTPKNQSMEYTPTLKQNSTKAIIFLTATPSPSSTNSPTVTPKKSLVTISNKNINNIGILYSIKSDSTNSQSDWIGYVSPEDDFLLADKDAFTWTSSINGFTKSLCLYSGKEPICKTFDNKSEPDLSNIPLVSLNKDFIYLGVIRNNVLSIYKGLEETGNPIITYNKSKIASGWIPVKISYQSKSRTSILHMINPSAKQEEVFLFDEKQSGLSLVPHIYLRKTQDYKNPSELMIGYSKLRERYISFDNNGNAQIIDLINGKTIEEFKITNLNESILPYIVDLTNDKTGVIKILFDKENQPSEIHLISNDGVNAKNKIDIKIGLNTEQVQNFYGIDFKISPDGTLLAMSDASTNTVYFVNTTNGNIETSKIVPSSPLKIEFDKTGRGILISFSSGEIQLWGVLE